MVPGVVLLEAVSVEVALMPYEGGGQAMRVYSLARSISLWRYPR